MAPTNWGRIEDESGTNRGRIGDEFGERQRIRKVNITDQRIQPCGARIAPEPESGAGAAAKMASPCNTGHDAKLRELLHNVTSLEIKLCSHGTKQFKKLLKGCDGGDFLKLYVQTSSELTELLQAWSIQHGKSGLRYISSLISKILSHSDGMYVPNDKESIGVSSALDKFARRIIREKKGDVDKELSSEDWKRQKSALLLLDSIVRRGSGLAYYVAKIFASDIPVSKLMTIKQKGSDTKGKHSVTKAFVRFAMSFLEVGKPEVLNLVLKMYTPVLRWLEYGDDETLVYVLSLLRDRVLSQGSLVPWRLKAILFGRDTLEQLIRISGREEGGPAAELAHNVLVTVCTDPSNGLMPDMTRHPNPVKGNPKQLLALMKKLKANEVEYHRDLLLAIVKGRPVLGSAYMDEFPYKLEDYESRTWFADISLAADLVSSVGMGLSFGFLHSQNHDSIRFESVDVQTIMNCICPRPFSRSVIGKGLRHSNSLVKHGALRLLSEMLKLLNSFVEALNHGSFCTSKMLQSLASVKREIQDKVQTLLPDPQDLVMLLSPLSSKRKADIEIFHERASSVKKLKKTILNDEKDIIISGIGYPMDSKTVTETVTADEMDNEQGILDIISEIWGPDYCLRSVNDARIFFYSKLLDVLTIYLRTMPTALQGSPDFLFKDLLNKSTKFPINLQSSLLSLLVQHVSVRGPPLNMYTHLKSYLNLLSSTTNDVKDKGYKLAHAAMKSTGAFDRNLHEIDAWFLYLPGYGKEKYSLEVQGAEVRWSLSSDVISFLCDAISTVMNNNNLFRHWDIVRQHTYCLKDFKDASPHFSPLVVCVIQKCLQVLNSKSGNSSVPKKTLISLYVCNTIKYLLQTQVDPRLLAALMESVISERLEDHCSLVIDSEDSLCEWRPLKNLLLFSQSVSHEQAHCIFPVNQTAKPGNSSFERTIEEVKNLLQRGHGGKIAEMAKAFFSVVLCTTPDEMLKNLPSVLAISQHLQIPVSLLSSIIFREQGFLADASKFWPEIFFAGLEMNLSPIDDEGNAIDAYGNSLFGESIMCNTDDDASVTKACSFLLKEAPFHILFPSIMSIDVPCLSNPSKLQNFLLSKLSACAGSRLLSSLRLVLFWFHQIQLSYRSNPSINLNQQSEICLIVVNKVFALLFSLKPNSEGSGNAEVSMSMENICEAAQTLFCHPAVTVSLTGSFSCDNQFSNKNICGGFESFVGLSREVVHTTDYQVLDMLKATFDCLFFPSSDQHALIRNEDGNKTLVEAFKNLALSLFVEVRKQFDMYFRSEDSKPLLPPFCALHALIGYMSPLKLLELAHWIFGRVDMNALTVEDSHSNLVLSIGIFIASSAFETLAAYLQQPIAKRVPSDFFWGMEENYFGNIPEEVYIEVCKFATKHELELADECLLKAVNVVYTQKYMQHQALHPVSLVMSRVIMSTPIEIISHCLHKTNTRRVKLLFLLTEISPLHLSVFGHLFLGILDSDLANEENGVSKGCDGALSLRDYVLLLPAAVSYMKSVSVKFGKQHQRHFNCIPSLYARILCNGWLNQFESDNFQEDYEDSFPLTAEDLHNIFNASLLGKAILMLRYHFAFNGYSSKLSLTNNEKLIDCDVNVIDSLSYNKSQNLINRVIAKITFGRILLFPDNSWNRSLSKEADCDVQEISVESREHSSRMQFVDMLVATWQTLVKKFPCVSQSSRNGGSKDHLPLFKYLEDFILKNILELATVMHDDLVKLPSIPFLEQMVRSSLLFRFKDPGTLDMLQNMLSFLSDGKIPHLKYLKLLLAHSQFTPTIRSVPELCSSEASVFFRLSSILRSVPIPESVLTTVDCDNYLESTKLYSKRLEIVKLLRTLLQSDAAKDPDLSLKEFHFLLLSSYGATLCPIDVEIYNLMCAIESFDKSLPESIAQTGYLWGNAAVKVRKQDMSLIITDVEVLEEHRRSRFRENLSIDPKICARTVLFFPYDKKFTQEKASDVENTQRYDPDFMLRFAINALSLSYIEPVEFAGLGLLAIAFVSMSSHDDVTRKLGYEALGVFKRALEKSQKKNDMIQLRILITYMQNGIEKEWQRIPPIIALFAAETSLILLDHTHNHYSTLSEFLTHSSKNNMNCIPLFDNFLWSSSVNFRTERLWILRLVYAGMNLNLENDALITNPDLNLKDDTSMYITNSTIEILLSFHASPISDNESKELILQIVKTSVKLQKMAQHLVQHRALLPWLSYVLSSCCGKLCGEEKDSSLRQLTVIIEIINIVILSRTTIEWLQNEALEQLMELSTHLYKLLIGGVKLKNENVTFVSSILQILMSTSKISQKRKLDRPHFTLAVESLYQIYQAVDAEIALQTILMSTPPVDLFQMGQEKLSNFLTWATSTASMSDSEPKESVHHPTIMSEEEPFKESLISKFQRWLIAYVILRKFPRENDNDYSKHRLSERSNLDTLLSLLEYVEKGSDKSISDCDRMLAGTIFYLHQLLGLRCRVLPSVVSAICLLLFRNAADITVDSILVRETLVASLLPMIKSPREANPAWAWSYDEPWEEVEKSERTDSEKMDEFHACQKLLVILSNFLGEKSLDSQNSMLQRVENTGVFEWERSIIDGEIE